MRSLIDSLQPQSNPDNIYPPSGNWLVSATAPANQIRDFHLSVAENRPSKTLYYFGFPSRIDDIQGLLSLADSQCIRIQKSGPIGIDSIDTLKRVIDRVSIDACIALVNNVSGMGYGNVFELLLATGTSKFFTCNIHAEFTLWTQSDWERSAQAQSALDALLDATYAHLGSGRPA